MEAYKKGQKVYVLPVGDYRDRNGEIHEPREGFIKTVGRIYFTIDLPCSRYTMELKFDKSYPFRQKTNYAPDYMLYFSHDDAINAQRKRHIFCDVRAGIAIRPIKSFTLEQLEKIKAVLDEKAANDGLPNEW